MLSHPMTRPRRALLIATLLAAAAGAIAACGEEGIDKEKVNTPGQIEAAVLFDQRCSGCHTLSAAGTRGSATDARDQERTDGVNFDARRVSEEDVLHALRNGGFGSRVMPANIVTGEDAEAVAAFLAGVSGRKAASTPDAALARPEVRRMRAPVAVDPDPSIGSASAAAVSDPRFQREVFDSAQALWRRQFAAAGAPYRDAHVVFFHTEIHTPCGRQTKDTGPFYCPAALGVYLNTDFFDALAAAFGLHSGYAAGYITAHEVGHHVQLLLGVHQRVAELNEQDPGGESRRSVQVELQADCYAGIWLHEVARAGELTHADVEDIVRAATVVGDDFQRNQAGKELAPETWTHGSSAQRVRWLEVGKASGVPAACDTFTVGQGTS
jgi:uncharacterized protein